MRAFEDRFFLDHPPAIIGVIPGGALLRADGDPRCHRLFPLALSPADESGIPKRVGQQSQTRLGRQGDNRPSQSYAGVHMMWPLCRGWPLHRRGRDQGPVRGPVDAPVWTGWTVAPGRVGFGLVPEDIPD